jgi:hypothetical protein
MSTAEIETAQPVSFPKEKCCVNVCHYFFIGIQKLFVDNKTLLLTTHSVHTAISFSLLHPHTINIFIYDDDDDDDGINSSTRSINQFHHDYVSLYQHYLHHQFCHLSSFNDHDHNDDTFTYNIYHDPMMY